MKNCITLAGLLALLLGMPLACLAAPTEGTTQELAVDVDNSKVIWTTLNKLLGKTVTLKLNSGEELAGTVKTVGTSAVHLSALTGKEFYDAVVPLDQISALIMRAKAPGA